VTEKNRGNAEGGGTNPDILRWLPVLGAPVAAGLAFAGQFLISLRSESVAKSLVPGVALYALAVALLIFALRAGRAAGAREAAGSSAAGQATTTSPEELATDRWLAGRAGWILLAIVLVAGLWLRLYRIDIVPRGLNNDEAINAIEANEIAAGKPFATVTRRGLNRETMFHYLAAVSYNYSGVGLNVLRAMPAVFGLGARFIRDPMCDFVFPLRAVAIAVGALTLLLLYLCVREWFGPRTALLAAIFMAVSPWHLLYSRVGLRTILAPPFALLTAALFVRALQKGTWQRHLAWGIAAGFGFWTYTTFRAVPLALIAFLLFRRFGGGLSRLAGARVDAKAGGTKAGRGEAVAAGSGGGIGTTALAGIGAMALLFVALMAFSGMTPGEFLFRGAYATTPPATRWGANLLHAVTMLNYFPSQYAVIQSDAFISDGVSAVFGLIGLEPDTLLLAAFATLGIVYVVWQALRRAASGQDGAHDWTAASVALFCLVATWLTVGWLGPSLTRMLAILPWLCLCAALFATRVWDDLARLKPPVSEWAAGALMAGVALLVSVQGISNLFWLAGRSERAMEHFGAAQTIMGMFVRSLPPDEDVVVLHTRRVDTLRYLIGDRPHVELLTDTSKVSLEKIVGAPRTVTFVVEYARPFAEPLRTLMMRFPQGDMTQVADARFDPDRPIFYTFTLWKDAEGKIIPAPDSQGPPPSVFESLPPTGPPGDAPPGGPPPDAPPAGAAPPG
jgi:hypothetical protein